RDLAFSMDQTRISIAKSQSVVDMLEAQLSGRAGSMARMRAVSTDHLATVLKDNIATDELKLIELQSKLQPGHPRLQPLQASVENTKKALSERIKDITSKAVPLDDVTDEATSGLITELSKAKAELIAQQQALRSQDDEV